jgi:hypothetical protein
MRLSFFKNGVGPAIAACVPSRQIGGAKAALSGSFDAAKRENL